MAKKKKQSKEIKENKTERKPSKKIISKENQQLIWFFLIIAVVFASFLGPYFYIEGLKKFDFAGIEWVEEKYTNLEVYHGRFFAFNGADLIYNIYVRNDPRTNNVSVEGEFNIFRSEGFISLGSGFENCRGEGVRVMADLSAFLRAGVGVRTLDVATTNLSFSKESGRTFADCSTPKDITVVKIQKGGGSWISQDEENPFCYTINVDTCDDIMPVEKFMIESISAFKTNSSKN